MAKILVIDDEKELVLLLKDELSRRGHEVWTAFDGKRGVELARKQPDFIVLDIMMPKMDGFEVCRRIREDVLCPIIFLSAKGSEEDKVKGLSLGGDDYVVKPFGLSELMARIQAGLRRQEREGLLDRGGRKLRFGDLTLDLFGRKTQWQGEDLEFTRREQDIVELLALHPGQVFSREHIYEKIWGYEGEGDSATVTEHIKKIRKKIAARTEEEFILTLWGIGYKWKGNV